MEKVLYTPHLSSQVPIIYWSSLCKQHKLHNKAKKEHDKHSNILHNFNKATIKKALSIQAKSNNIQIKLKSNVQENINQQNIEWKRLNKQLEMSKRNSSSLRSCKEETAELCDSWTSIWAADKDELYSQLCYVFLQFHYFAYHFTCFMIPTKSSWYKIDITKKVNTNISQSNSSSLLSLVILSLLSAIGEWKQRFCIHRHLRSYKVTITIGVIL